MQRYNVNIDGTNSTRIASSIRVAVNDALRAHRGKLGDDVTIAASRADRFNWGRFDLLVVEKAHMVNGQLPRHRYSNEVEVNGELWRAIPGTDYQVQYLVNSKHSFGQAARQLLKLFPAAEACAIRTRGSDKVKAFFTRAEEFPPEPDSDAICQCEHDYESHDRGGSCLHDGAFKNSRCSCLRFEVAS